MFSLFTFWRWCAPGSSGRILPSTTTKTINLGAGQRYLAAFPQWRLARDGELRFQLRTPSAAKLNYALVQLPLPDAPLIPEKDPSTPIVAALPQPQFSQRPFELCHIWHPANCRPGTVDPLAGLFLALNNWQIKYTSQIMLEPLPALTSLLMVLCYTQSKTASPGWLLASALMLGITAASKYVYCIDGLQCRLIGWRTFGNNRQGEEKQGQIVRSLLPLAALGLVCAGLFFAADPYLWANPLVRLKQSLAYHGRLCDQPICA